MQGYDASKIIKELDYISLDAIWKQYEEKEIQKLILSYNPETNILHIGWVAKDGFEWLEKVECDIYTYSALLTGIINNTFYITANTEKPENIAVEFGEFK